MYGLTPYAQLPQCYAPLQRPSAPAGQQAQQGKQGEQQRQGSARPAVCEAEVWAPRKSGAQIAIDHYKWHAGLLASAARRLRHYRSPADGSGRPRIPWYTESEAVLAHVARNGMCVNVSGSSNNSVDGRQGSSNAMKGICI